MQKTLTTAICVSMLALGACTTTQKVNVMQPGDQAMTCAQLRTQFAQLDQVKNDGEHDQGVNVANVAALVLFWPAIAGNYLSARDALQLAEQRRTYLMGIYNDHHCDNPANASLTFRVPLSMLVVPVARGMH